MNDHKLSRRDIRKLYPSGKKKAFNITYDDGILQDVRFVELLNRYNLKGTFNLNSKLMEERFAWIHPSGAVIRRLAPEVAVELYQGHEVACHTATHPNLEELSEEMIMQELQTDKKKLEVLFGRKIVGFAVPFHYYSSLVETCVRKCGFLYARISEESYSFSPQGDYYWWRSGMFHLNAGLRGFVQDFLSCDEELAFCQIVGHSYDLDTENLWDAMDSLLCQISQDENVFPVTTEEFVRYIRAMNSAQITDCFINNPSQEDLWFDVDGDPVMIKAGQCQMLDSKD